MRTDNQDKAKVHLEQPAFPVQFSTKYFTKLENTPLSFYRCPSITRASMHSTRKYHNPRLLVFTTSEVWCL